MTHPLRTAGLGLATLAAIALTVLPGREARSDDARAAEKPSPVEGAWKQVEQKNGDAQDSVKPPEGTEMVICITGGRFVWTVVQGGKVVALAGGKYKVDKDTYSEIIEFVYGDGVPESFVGSTFAFTAKVDGDTWHKVGTIKVGGQDYKIDETWRRCK